MTIDELLALCHQQAHDAEHDFEDSVFMSLTRRELWLLLMATVLLSESSPCLKPNCLDFNERLSEIIDTQKPHWRNGYTPPEA